MTTTRLFLGLMIIGPLHLVEQLFTSVEELDVFKRLVADYYGAMSWLDSDRATVILVVIVVTFFSYLVFGVLVGGHQRLAVLAFFGLLGVGEAHHLVQAALTFGYDAGLITAVPYAVVGGLMIRAVRREFVSMKARHPVMEAA